MSTTALALGLTLSFYDKLSGPLQAAQDQLRGTSHAARELQEKLARATGQSRQIERFEAMKYRAREYNEQLAKARQRVAELSAKIAATENPSQKMQSALAGAQRTLVQLTDGAHQNWAKMRALRREMNDGGVSTTHLAAEQSRLRGEIDQLTGALQRHNAAAARTAQIRDRLNRYSTAVAAGGAVLTGAGMVARAEFSDSVRAFAELENASVRLRSSMSDATGKISPLFAGVDALAQRLGAAMPGTTRDFYGMFEVMLNSGVGAQSIIDGVGESAAKLAVVLNVSYDEAARAVSRLKNATGVADGEMLAFLDTVQRTKSLGVDLGDMEYAFSRAAGKLKELNIQGLDAADSLSVLYASWIRTGLSGETVGTGFASILGSLQQLTFGEGKKNADARSMLKDLGISLQLFDKAGNFRGVDNMVTELTKLGRLDPGALNQVLTQIFGSGTDAQMVASVIKDGRAGFDALRRELESKSSLATKADMQTATLANLWEAVGGTWDNLRANLIGSIQVELKGAIDLIGQVQTWLDGLMTRFPVATKSAAALLATLAVGLPVIGGLAIGLSVLLRIAAFAAPGLVALTAAVRGLGAALLFIARAGITPIGLILIGIGVAAVLVWQHWDIVKGWLVGAWEWIKSAAMGVAHGIQWAFLNMTPVGQVIQHWDQIKTTVGGFVDYVAGLPARLFNLGSAIAQGLADGVRHSLGAVRESVVGMADGAVDWVKNVLDINSPSRVFAALGGHIAAGLALGITHRAPQALQAVGRLGALLPGALPGALALGMSAAGAPAIATAAPLTPTPMIPTAQTRGDIHIHINVSVPAGVDGHDIARRVADEVERATRGLTVRARSRLYDEEQ